MNTLTSRKIAMFFVMVFQAIMIIIFAFFVKYDRPPLFPNPGSPNVTASVQGVTEQDSAYPLFQDIHVMVFVGFGFLMTFLKRYAYGALGFTFLVASLVMQWAILVGGFLNFRSVEDRIYMNVFAMMKADIAAVVILISLGAVIGRISPIQILLMAIFETVLYAGNEYLNDKILEAVDAGGSIYVHAFGAYFGLAVSFVLTRGVIQNGQEFELESATYQSDITSMIGTLFLWVFWPSFTAGLLDGEQKWRAIVNTYLALTSSCMMAFALSSILNKEKKFEMAHVQNATLAGGVCIGTAVNMKVQPFGALIIGAVGGVLSTIGFRFIQGFLRRKLSIIDTCGVNNLHGMPGVTSSLIAAVVTLFASRDIYHEELPRVFPAMGPPHNRSAGVQFGFQLAALACTLGMAIAGGMLTGLAIRSYGRVEDKYDDDVYWDLPEEMRKKSGRTVQKF